MVIISTDWRSISSLLNFSNFWRVIANSSWNLSWIFFKSKFLASSVENPATRSNSPIIFCFNPSISNLPVFSFSNSSVNWASFRFKSEAIVSICSSFFKSLSSRRVSWILFSRSSFFTSSKRAVDFPCASRIISLDFRFASSICFLIFCSIEFAALTATNCRIKYPAAKPRNVKTPQKIGLW